MTTKTKNMADTREDIRTAIFSLAYQQGAEEQWGGEDSTLTPEQIAVTVRHLERAYAKLTSKEEADEIYRSAYRSALLHIHGD